MKKLLILLLISSSLLAKYEYELLDFYNGKNEFQTQDQLLTHLNMTHDSISDFDCTNINRDQLFTAYKEPNIKANSIKIEDENKIIYTYTSEGILKGERIYKPKRKDVFLRKAIQSLSQLEKTPTGSVLINFLKTSPYPIIIAYSKRSYFYPNYTKDRYKNLWNEAQFVRMMDTQTPHFFDKIRFKNIGAGGKIFWFYDSKSTSIESDNKKRITAPAVILAHEMYHAYDSIRGLLDTRYVQSKDLESIGLLEYRASFMENSIREELGFKLRKFYSDPSDLNTPGLLDENLRPIFLKSSCIKWL